MNSLFLQEVLSHSHGLPLEVNHYISTKQTVSSAVSWLGCQAKNIMMSMEPMKLSKASNFIKYIEHVRQTWRDKFNDNAKFVICCDNSTVHKNRIVEEYCKKYSINIIFIIAYSPWLNPVEGYIGRIKSRLSSEKKQGK